MSNHYLIKTHSAAALLYNDNSVNENGHAATAFRLLAQPECNFLSGFERDEQRFVRRLVISIGALNFGSTGIDNSKTRKFEIWIFGNLEIW